MRRSLCFAPILQGLFPVSDKIPVFRLPISFRVIVIKLLSLMLGLLVGVKRTEKGLLKGLSTAILYSAVCYLTFFFANGKSFSGVTVFDVVVPIVASMALGAFVVNLKGRA